MPVRLGDRAFALVLKKFVDRGEKDARAAGFDADVEVEFVGQEVDVAFADHAEEFARHFEIVGVDDAVLDRESGICTFRDAVTSTGNNLSLIHI